METDVSVGMSVFITAVIVNDRSRVLAFVLLHCTFDFSEMIEVPFRINAIYSNYARIFSFL